MTRGDQDALEREVLARIRGTVSLDDLVRMGPDAMGAVRRARYPEGGQLPRWVRELDAAGDMTPGAAALSAALGDLVQAATSTERARAMAALAALAPTFEAAADGDGELLNDIAAALAPILEEMAQRSPPGDGPREPPAGDPSSSASVDGDRAFVPALFDYWAGGDTPGIVAPEGMAVPRLADPDTWRTVFVWLTTLRSRTDTRTDVERLVPAERVNDWRTFSIECALWRDAIDGLGQVEAWPDVREALGAMRRAATALGQRVGPSLGLPSEDLAEAGSGDAAGLRVRLTRWIVARCALAGLVPRPRTGAVGTAGRALLSILDALSATEPARRCAWPDCQQLLPPHSFAHRRYCDDHRRQAASERTARLRRERRSLGGT